MQPGAVQHNPQVVHFDAEDLADLFALKTVDLSQRESTSGALWQRRETVVEIFQKSLRSINSAGVACQSFGA